MPIWSTTAEITPAGIGVLALAGFAEVDVHRLPRVGVLANGDELVGFESYDDVKEGDSIEVYEIREVART